MNRLRFRWHALIILLLAGSIASAGAAGRESRAFPRRLSLLRLGATPFF
jgi:hypothetical protein